MNMLGQGLTVCCGWVLYAVESYVSGHRYHCSASARTCVIRQDRDGQLGQEQILAFLFRRRMMVHLRDSVKQNITKKNKIYALREKGRIACSMPVDDDDMIQEGILLQVRISYDPPGP